MDSPPPPTRETELLANLAWVQALARKLVSDPAIADDVSQQACLISLERPPRATEGAPFRAWLARVTRTLARQRFRSETSRMKRERSAASLDAAPSTDDVVTRAALQQRVVAAVMALDEPERSTVLLRYFDNLDSREIARRRHETPEAVRKRLSRALDKLRLRLGREFDEEGKGGLLALAPLAFADRGKVTLTTIGLLGGGILMTKTAVAVGLAALAAVVGVAWIATGGGDLLPGGETAAADESPVVDLEIATDETVVADELSPLGLTESLRASSPDVREAVFPGALYSILDSDGLMLGGARLKLCADGEIVARGQSNEAGEFGSTLDRDGEAALLVVAPDWAPQVHRVPLTAGRHEVRLREGEVVAGWIIVDGGIPGEAIPVQLRSDRGFVDIEEDLGLSSEVMLRETREHGGSYAPEARTRTTTEGTFRIAGLPANWSGSVRWSSEFRLRDQIEAESDFRPHSLHLDRARRDVRIDVVRRPVLSGRVVDYPDGADDPVPVSGALVEDELDYGDVVADSLLKARATSDEEGRFRIPLLDLSIKGGGLYITSGDHVFSRRIEIEPMELQGSTDLGDLALIEPEERGLVRLLVQEEDGSPIAGAIAGTASDSPISEATDESGRTALRGVIPGESTIFVLAFGWETEWVQMPSHLTGDLVVTMRRGSTLELRIRSSDGEPAYGVVARIWSAENPCRAMKSRIPLSTYRAAGCTWPHTVRPDDGTIAVRLNANPDGNITLNDVRAGVPLRMRIEGRFGATVHERAIPALKSEERRILDVDLPRRPLTLRGRVVDESGRPLPTASHMSSGDSPDTPPGMMFGGGGGVNENGEFEIAGIYTSHIHLSVIADGFVPIRHRAFEVPVDSSQVEFQLEPACVLTVLLRDEGGQPVEGRVHSELPSGSWVSGRPVVDTPGSYLLRGVPHQEIVVKATVHGAVFEQAHDPGVPTLTITIPGLNMLGEVEVTLQVQVPASRYQRYIRLLPVSGEGLIPRHSLQYTGSAWSIPGVRPGRYVAVLQQYMSEEGGEDAWEDLSTRVPVEVRIREKAEVLIDQ